MLDDEIDQATQIGGIGTTAIRTRPGFARGADVVARGEMVHVCVDRDTRQTVPVPDWLRERAVTDEV
jgi:acyl-CoA thioesterase FadM